MIKKIVFLLLVIIISYYAGSKGIKPKEVIDWFQKNNVTQILKNKILQSVDFRNETKLKK